MPRKFPSLFAIACLLTAGLIIQNSNARAASSQAQDPATQDAEEHEESAMELQMKRVEEAMRLLRRSIRKPQARADSVGHVQECQEGFLLAKAMTPLLLANIPEAEQSAFKRDFRLAVIEAMEAFLDLERALLEERDDDARELYKKARALEDPAHERFTEDG